MDFWSRLVAGTSLASTGKQASASTPEKRLARFKKELSQLLRIWRTTSDASRNQEVAGDVCKSLQDLTGILIDESRRPLPHPCISCAAFQQIYIPIGKIAITSRNEGVIREGVALFATLIDSEEEEFAENDAFSRSLMDLLVRITGANSIRLGSDTEVEVVELAFNITTKIRLEPEILPVWFTAQDIGISHESNEKDAHEVFTGKKHKEDFPLFYLLIDYIHHEGRIGDFARTGLLYIIEAASTSLALEQWIVESDLATLMATGLGALYSQLSRKLVIEYSSDQLPPILAFSDYNFPNTTPEIVGSASPDFQGHMETFLSHLVFWQDVLNHCKSVEVQQTLLEHFQVIFLQQLLYPSLLESSDVDGGSSVAVLTYLRRILEALDHPDMIHLILHYLLALPDVTPTSPISRASTSAARRRKSVDLATMMASHLEPPSTPALFNLVDLIQASLRSEHQQTISVTLQLVSVILRRHHRYAVTTLLRTSQVLMDGPRRTIGAHERELDYLLNLAGNLGGDHNFDQVYEDHVQDCMSVLESHICSIPLVAPKLAGGIARFAGAQASIPGAPRDIRPHTLRPEDPILETIVGILQTFFTNSVETNLSLTGTIIDLATCGFMHIDGWLLPEPSTYIYPSGPTAASSLDQPAPSPTSPTSRDQTAQLLTLRRARIPLDLTRTKLPALLSTFQKLVDQATYYRTTIPRFSDLLQQRRDAFQTASRAFDHTQTHTPMHPSTPRSTFSNPATESPPRQSALDTLAHRIFSDLPSRSVPRRGRRSRETSTSQTSNLGHNSSIGTPSGPRQSPARFSMMGQGGLENSSRVSSEGAGRAYSSSPMRDAEDGLLRKGVPLSQARAFVTVDQEILFRKVGILDTSNSAGKVEAVPFPDLRTADPANGTANVEGVPDIETTDDRKAELEAQSENSAEGKSKQVTVSHVLTNVLVLQDFLLELAALVQVRAGLFAEVKML